MSALWPPALLLSRLQCLSLTFSALVSPQPPSAHSGRALPITVTFLRPVQSEEHKTQQLSCPGPPSSPGHPCPHPLATHVLGHSHFLGDHPGTPPAPEQPGGSAKGQGGNSLPRVPPAPEGLPQGLCWLWAQQGCSGTVWIHAWPACCPRGKTDQNNSAQHPFTGGIQAEGTARTC